MLLLTYFALAFAPSDWTAPAGLRTAAVVPGGVSILPNGRLLTPKGDRIYTGGDLWHIAVGPNDRLVGIHDGGLSHFDSGSAPKPKRNFVAKKDLAPAGTFIKDGKFFVTSGGEDGSVEILDTTTWETVREIKLNVDGVTEAFVVDLVVTKKGDLAYCLDVANQQVVTVDLGAGKVLNRVAAGRQPYAIALEEATQSLFVANIGIFNYSALEGRGISRPAFGFPSKAAEDGTMFEGKMIPGLGSAVLADAHSVWKFSTQVSMRPKFLNSVKTGVLIQAPTSRGKAIGGSAPCALSVIRGKVWVSNANNDTVQVFDGKSLQLEKTIRLAINDAMKDYRGIIPTGLTFDEKRNRVYVAESGLNAVAAIDVRTGTVLGHFPSGWFPLQTRLSENGNQLFVATQKGLGRGPQGPKSPKIENDERAGVGAMPGMIQRITVPTDKELKGSTLEVLKNNGITYQAPTPPTVHPEIKHVVFITKENHTFDGIFGNLEGANGEPSYAEFGDQGWIREKGRDTRLPIMPNHLALARQWSISDNFYMEPQASGDGHRWLVGVYPSLWTTRVFYAGWKFKRSKTAPGRLVPFGSNGSQIPEDYLENGSLWEHLDRNGISFRNYGEGFEFPGVDEGAPRSKSGAGEVANYPMPKVLFDNTCFEFPIYNNNIPDIARADWFIEDIEKNYRAKKKPLPQFMNIAICNDHGSTPRPKEGYPYVSSFMADNDLALGRIVEYLSKQPEWKNTLILVTQDDTGGDNDHVDRHRSFVMALGPWAKKGYVSKQHTSIMSIIKTIYTIFGIGPNNLFDAVTTSLTDMIAKQPDYTGYTAIMSDPRVFKPEETFDPSDPTFKKRRLRKSIPMDDPAFIDWMRKGG